MYVHGKADSDGDEISSCTAHEHIYSLMLFSQFNIFDCLAIIMDSSQSNIFIYISIVKSIFIMETNI